MIISEIFDLPKNKNLTKKDIEKFFFEKKIMPVKWAIAGVANNSVKILVSYEKKIKKPL